MPTTTMPFDYAWLDDDAAERARSLYTGFEGLYMMDVESVKAQPDGATFGELTAPEIHSVEDFTLDGPHGPLPIRLYKPSARTALPVLLYLHGGGYIIGSIDAFDAFCRRLALAYDCAVVSVEYRLAPEFKFPVPQDECYAAAEWIVAEGAGHGLDVDRIVVGGDSVGGDLTASVTFRARDESGPKFRGQILINSGFERDPLNVDPPYRSLTEMGDSPNLKVDDILWCHSLRLGEEADWENPYAVPMRQEDFIHLPRAFMLTAACDPSRDLGERFGRRLAEAGVPTLAKRYPGVMHGFVLDHDHIARGREAIRDIGWAIEAMFALD